MTRRVPKFVALPRIPEGLPPQLQAYLSDLHILLRQLIEPLSELGGRTSISLDDHITNTSRDDHTQYLNVERHDTTARHPLGSVVPTSETPPPNIGASSSAGTANAVARSDHTHGHGDLSGIGGIHHHWDQISNKPATYPPDPHTHPLGDLTQSGATTNQVPKWSGTAWTAGFVDRSEITNFAHTHDAADIVSGVLAPAQGGLGKVLSPTYTDDYIVVYKAATDNFVMEAKPTAQSAMPSGYLNKDYDPPLQTYYGYGQVGTYVTYDVGEDAQILPLRAELPPAMQGGGDPLAGEPPIYVYPRITYVFHDGTSVYFENTDTLSGLVKNFEDLIALIATPENNGKSIRQIVLGYSTMGPSVADLDVGVFKIRNFVTPRGTGVMP